MPLRIIYCTRLHPPLWCIENVEDRGDHFYLLDKGWSLPKADIHYTVATLEKERKITELFRRRSDIDRLYAHLF